MGAAHGRWSGGGRWRWLAGQPRGLAQPHDAHARARNRPPPLPTRLLPQDDELALWVDHVNTLSTHSKIKVRGA